MTGHTTLARSHGTGTARMLLVILLLTSGLALLGLVVNSVIYFATPPENFIDVGPVEEFPPSDQPYVIHTEGEQFFVVNTAGELFAFNQYPLHTRSTNCRLQWQTKGNYFAEGCWGTKFNLDGSYLTGPPATMQRYPLVVEDGKVLVDLTRKLHGPELITTEGVITAP